MNSTRKKDLKFGKKNLLANDEFDPKYGKERISLLLDMQVVDAFKKRAEDEGKKYQVLIRETLRSTIFGQGEEVEDRLKRLEAKVFKKHG